MTPHNQAILSFLNDYLTMDKPGYAVFLKGNWGCGKTYFIREWMESLKEEKDEGEDIIAQNPVYVSLYGLSSASQIDESLFWIQPLPPIMVWTKSTYKPLRIVSVRLS